MSDVSSVFMKYGIKAGDRFYKYGTNVFVFKTDGNYVFNGSVMVPFIEAGDLLEEDNISDMRSVYSF